MSRSEMPKWMEGRMRALPELARPKWMEGRKGLEQALDLARARMKRRCGSSAKGTVAQRKRKAKTALPTMFTARLPRRTSRNERRLIQRFIRPPVVNLRKLSQNACEMAGYCGPWPY
jgi:hypothetical protein